MLSILLLPAFAPSDCAPPQEALREITKPPLSAARIMQLGLLAPVG